MTMNSFFLSLSLSWHVVVRNWVVYRKDFLANISPTLADPALMLTALGMGLSPFIGEIGGLTYAQYLAPGMVATTALFTAFFESSYGFYVKMTFESVFKAMLTTPIGVREVVVGEFMWGYIRAGLMGGTVGLVLLAMGLLPNPWAVLAFPFISGLLAVPCGAIGLLATALVRNINQFQTVYSFLIAPIFYLSGVFFPLADRPVLSILVQFSPFYHGVRLLQLTAWSQWDLGAILWHLSLLLVFTAGLGYWAYRKIEKKLTI
jgi:lipooligosaccharide transport system permease protein